MVGMLVGVGVGVREIVLPSDEESDLYPLSWDVLVR
jgi:hypothetical protein